MENQGDCPVLFLEGEELRGAKQNRILNTTVLIAGKSRTVIPVSCVERGRWDYRTRRFGSSGTRSSSKLRHALKSSVARSLKQKRGHRSDQMAVWAEVGRLQKSLGTASQTGALADTFEAYRSKMEEFEDRLKYVEGASGAAIVVSGRLLSVDLFDRPATCQRVWNRMLSGMVLDAVEAGTTGEPPEAGIVEQTVRGLGQLDWERVETVGLGEESRAKGLGLLASMLAWDGVPVHVSMVAE